LSSENHLYVYAFEKASSPKEVHNVTCFISCFTKLEEVVLLSVASLMEHSHNFWVPPHTAQDPLWGIGS